MKLGYFLYYEVWGLKNFAKLKNGMYLKKIYGNIFDVLYSYSTWVIYNFNSVDKINK